MNVFILDVENIEYGKVYQLAKQQLDVRLINLALEKTNGNQTETARLLGINRGTLRKLIKEYQIRLQFQSINPIG